MLSSNPIRILIRNNRISYPQFTTSVYLVLLTWISTVPFIIQNWITARDDPEVRVVQRLLMRAGRDKWQWINGNF